MEINEQLARMITEFDQIVMFVGAISFQIVLLIMIARRQIRWRYTVLVGTYMFHATLFYAVNFFVLPPCRELSWFMTAWSSVFRVHGFVVVVILFTTLYRYCKLWTYKSHSP